MCVDCVLALPRIAQVDPGDGPPLEVVLSQWRWQRGWGQGQGRCSVRACVWLSAGVRIWSGHVLPG
jgi:hypothetical protein